MMPSRLIHFPFAQFGGMNGQQIIDALTNDYLYYGGIGVVLLVVLFFARFLFRSLVNRRVHGIQESSMGFMDLDAMYKKGLISREEYLEMRQRVARRELDRIKEMDTSRESLNLVSTVAKNPALARVLLEREIQKAKSSEDGLSAPAGPAPAPPAPSQAESLPAANPEAIRRIMEKEWIIPGDPLSDSRLARKVEPKPMPPPPTARGGKKPMDIEDLLMRGLISREEYERLAALFERSE